MLWLFLENFTPPGGPPDLFARMAAAARRFTDGNEGPADVETRWTGIRAKVERELIASLADSQANRPPLRCSPSKTRKATVSRRCPIHPQPATSPLGPALMDGLLRGGWIIERLRPALPALLGCRGHACADLLREHGLATAMVRKSVPSLATPAYRHSILRSALLDLCRRIGDYDTSKTPCGSGSCGSFVKAWLNRPASARLPRPSCPIRVPWRRPQAPGGRGSLRRGNRHGLRGRPPRTAKAWRRLMPAGNDAD